MVGLDPVTVVEVAGWLFAVIWSYSMARYVAPWYVTRKLRQTALSLSDPNDPDAAAIRQGFGSLVGMTMGEFAKDPALLKPVLTAATDTFWTTVRMKSLGAKGGQSGGAPGLPLPGDLGELGVQGELMEAAMEAGPELVEGVLEMFGVSARSAKAISKVLVRVAPMALRPGGQMRLPTLTQGNGGGGLPY